MSKIVQMYVDLITAPGSTYTLEQVPTRWREAVREALENLNS